MSHFYKIRSNALSLIVEPDFVSVEVPPGNYIIFGDKETKSNQFQIVSVDMPDLTKDQWESYFFNGNIKVVSIEKLKNPKTTTLPYRKIISVIFEKNSDSKV